nr:hypothetical protein [Trentepohlia sp. YN1242]
MSHSIMDAHNNTYRCLYNGEKFVLNSDIQKCFDKINHSKLLNKIRSTEIIQLQIHAWLKEGILNSENNTSIYENDKETARETVISPLLRVIALYGFEKFIQNIHRSILNDLKLSWSTYQTALHVVRFRDHFVIIHPSLEVIKALQQHIKKFLVNEIDLELHDNQISICSTLNTITINNKEIKPGFDFLGFNFKIYTSKSVPAKSNNYGTKTEFRPYSKPSFNSMTCHLQEIARLVKKHRGISQSALISKLSPIINEWTHYYKFCSAKKAFSFIDNKLFGILYKWALRRHPNKSRKWVLEKYFHKYEKRSWVFSCISDGKVIKTMPFHRTKKLEKYTYSERFSPFCIEQLIKVENFKLNKTGMNLFKRQEGICRWCLGTFMPSDKLEIYHIFGENHPKREYEIYKWLLHLHCHEELHQQQFKETEFPY